MPIKADAPNQKEFKIAPEGTHVARCYQIIHWGHQPNTFPGAESAWVNQVRIVFELPDEKTVFAEGKEPQPFSVGADFTLSMHAKSRLRPLVEGWLGKKFTDEEAADFDLETLLGQPCFITIAHKKSPTSEKTYANIVNVTKLPAKYDMPANVNPYKIISLETLTRESFDALPEWFQEKFKTAQEYQRWTMKGSKGAGIGNVDYPTEKVNAEDIPF